MENDFIVNIIHRPEMVPEYAEKVTGQGKRRTSEESLSLPSHWISSSSSRRLHTRTDLRPLSR